ncbi:MAG: undecaprenyl-phosphate glucose phosphotransferase [Gammaproteobacteria bacterium]
MGSTGLVRKNGKIIVFMQSFLDVIVIALTLLLARVLWDQPVFVTRVLMLLFTSITFFSFFANMAGLYRSSRAERFWEEYRLALMVFGCALLALLILGYATKTTALFSRLAIGTWILLVPFALLAERIAVRMWLTAGHGGGYQRRRIAIVGTGKLAQNLAKEIRQNDWMGLDIGGFYDSSLEHRYHLPETDDIPVAGDVHALVAAARRGALDEVFIALPINAHHLTSVVVNELCDSSIPVHIVPDLFTCNLLNTRMSHLGRVPLVSLFQSPLDELGVLVKRTEDVLISSMILCLIAVPMLAIAIGIKLTSPGPVIFRQRRYGLKGEEIMVWKFRSMSVMEDGGKVKQAGRNDARVTRFGAFLRRTSLDELPQFINVLQGSMSIVGPRPHAVAHNEQYRRTVDGYMLRHLVKPGITGWAQVNGWRGETDTPEKMEKRVEFDLQYLRNWSLELDLKIILMTVFKGFVGKNAY